MRTLSIFTSLAASLPAMTVQAHTSTVPHAHPHQHIADGLPPGLDALTLVALGLFAIAGATAATLARARQNRRKK